MNSLARKFFQVDGNFSEVRILSEEPKITWEEISKIPSDLPKSWFELSRVSSEDRIDFTREFWLANLPFNPLTHPMIIDFFNRLDDVGVLLRKENPEDIFSAELVYSLADGSTFFRGLSPPVDQEIIELKKDTGALLPSDYLSFLQIHNGFGKLSEIGLLKIEDIPDIRRQIVDLILKAREPLKSGDNAVDAGALIPFFESLGYFSFQCFYSDWYPGNEMGNVYLSGIDYTLSDVNDRKRWTENLAFPTFLDWFVYYLQGMNLSP